MIGRILWIVSALGLAAAAAAQPEGPVRIVAGEPDERTALGLRLARAGDFNAIVGAVGAAEIERLARETPDLSDAERDRLREVGRRRLEAGRERLLAAVGTTYGRRFTAEQLRAIVAFFEGPAGRAYTGALPGLLPEIAAAMQGVDLAAAVRADFCRETGKLCDRPAE